MTYSQSSLRISLSQSYWRYSVSHLDLDNGILLHHYDSWLKISACRSPEALQRCHHEIRLIWPPRCSEWPWHWVSMVMKRIDRTPAIVIIFQLASSFSEKKLVRTFRIACKQINYVQVLACRRLATMSRVRILHLLRVLVTMKSNPLCFFNFSPNPGGAT